MAKKQPKLKWEQSNFIENIPIYYVTIPIDGDQEAACLRIEYDYNEKIWIIDICSTIRMLGGVYNVTQVNEVKVFAEKKLSEFVKTINKLYKNVQIKPLAQSTNSDSHPIDHNGHIRD